MFDELSAWREPRCVFSKVERTFKSRDIFKHCGEVACFARLRGGRVRNGGRGEKPCCGVEGAAQISCLFFQKRHDQKGRFDFLKPLCEVVYLE